MFIASLFIIAKREKQPKLPNEEWISNYGIAIQWNIIYLPKGMKY